MGCKVWWRNFYHDIVPFRYTIFGKHVLAGEFEIQFLPESQKKYNLLANQTGPFMAVESSAYFESYVHVLSGMKELTEDAVPLSKYIVK